MTRTARTFATLLALPVASGAMASECAFIEAMQASDTPTANATCSTYSTEALQTATACYWPHAFRNEDAIQFAEKLWAELISCQTGEALADDQLVNHPDSYAPRTWSTAEARWTVSVKDKAALNKTLVFLRFEPKP